MSSDESDVESLETHSMDLPKTPPKIPKIPSKVVMELRDTKKLSTKEMIHKALSESKSRKGISLYAIKKYMQVNFGVDVEKINYLIKKNIKESVESGTIIQTKGIGASGSFRLAPGSKQPKKPLKRPKKSEEATEKEKKLEKPKKSSSKSSEDGKPKKVAKTATLTKTVKEDTNESKTKPSTIKDNQKPSKTKPSSIKDSQKPSKTKPSTIKDNQIPATSGMKTPKKKSTMMKRKSIGSIIKKPKMKPAKA